MRFPRPSSPASPPHCLAPSLAGLLLAGLLLGGCEVATPELPTFDTRLSLPVGDERLDILDLVDDQDYLTALADGTLGFTVEGEADTVSLDFDLGADLPAQALATELGRFALEVTPPAPFEFVLGDLYPPAVLADGLTTVVPAFVFGSSGSGQDLQDLASATISEGALIVTVTNGLPVPVSGPGAPVPLQFVLTDAVGGGVLAVVDFPDEIAAGGQAQSAADLAGVTLPDQVAVDLQGGSPGSGAGAVLVDAQALITVAVAFTTLTVDQAEAVVPAQSAASSFTVDLPADYEVLSARIGGGGVDVTMTNDLPIACRAQVAWAEVFDSAGAPLTVFLDLAPGASAVTRVDFAGCTVQTGDGTLLTALTSTIAVTSAGSGGQSVVLRSDMGVAVDVGAGRLAFDEVTGLVPAVSFDLDAVEAAIDLPDALSGLELTRATLELEVTNTSGVEAVADLVLAGVNEADQRVDLLISEAIAGSAEPTRGVTTIVLDETNSGIVDFLNNLPTRISLTGVVSAGGPGVIGTVSTGDRASIGWRITAPVEIVVDGARLSGDPEALDLEADTRDLIRDHAGAAEILMRIGNHLPFAVEARLVFGIDPTGIAVDPLLTVGPVSVAAGEVDPATHLTTGLVVSTPTVSLTAAECRLLATEGLVSQIEILLPGGGETARVMTTDFVTFQGMISMDVEVSDD